jgi:hypothetical protein
MAQQHVKLLLSYLLKPKKGSEFEYLTKTHQNIELKNLDSNSILMCFEFLSSLMLKKVGLKMKKEGSLKEAWNNNLMRLVECSKINSIYYILKSFKQSIEHCDDKLKSILSNLVLLFALHNLYEERALFMENNILLPKQIEDISTQIFSLCKELRRDAIVLVDSFDLPDFVIKSEIGKYDGNIYENYFNKIKSHL